MEALKQVQIEDNYESFIELVADYEQDELDQRIGLLTRIEKERKFAQSQTRLTKADSCMNLLFLFAVKYKISIKKV